MTPDPDPDVLLAELLDAARREAPSPEVKERAMRAPERRRSTPWAGKWLLAALALGGLGLAAAFVPERPRSDIRAESAHPRAQVRTSGESATHLENTRVAAPPVVLVPTKQKPTPNARPLTLEAELAMLDDARTALVQGDPRRALGGLDIYERRATARRLGAEASLLRIQILAASGRAQEAATLARKFMNEHSASPLAERAKSFVPEQAMQENEGALP